MVFAVKYVRASAVTSFVTHKVDIKIRSSLVQRGCAVITMSVNAKVTDGPYETMHSNPPSHNYEPLMAPELHGVQSEDFVSRICPLSKASKQY
jgi:hypothetical protein